MPTPLCLDRAVICSETANLNLVSLVNTNLRVLNSSQLRPGKVKLKLNTAEGKTKCFLKGQDGCWRNLTSYIVSVTQMTEKKQIKNVRGTRTV